MIDLAVLAAQPGAAPTDVGLYLDGGLRDGSGPLIDLVSRLDGRVMATVHSASPDDVADAYSTAHDAQRRWARSAPAVRADIFSKAAQLFRDRAAVIGSLISDEMGKPIGEARTEVTKGAAILEYYAQAPYRALGEVYVTDTGEDVTVFDEPLGVVALITPWNFPFTLPMRKIAASLATGNAAVFKPATNASLCGLAIAQTMSDAGLPAGVLNVVIGKSSLIEQALFTDRRLAGVSLTGSYPTAAAIRRVLPVEIPYQAELGGKNPLLIWSDADVGQALEIITASSFRNNGQICTSCGRLLVHTDIAAPMLEALRSSIGARPQVSVDGEHGIMSSAAEDRQIRDLLDRSAGSIVETIRSPWDPERLAPTVLVDPSSDEVLREEIFGPVITFETVSSLDEAIAKANDVSYGLTAGIVTNDLTVAQQFWAASSAGTVKVNAPLTGTPYHVPLEGFGQSGVGAGEGGSSSIHFFTRRKAVHMRRPPHVAG
jgi:acyl-CoA reductase-like NAD-dependent aldehyde dehydrogenase